VVVRYSTYSRCYVAVQCQRRVGSVGRSAQSLSGSSSTVPALGSNSSRL
jgi:hypothetical protein